MSRYIPPYSSGGSPPVSDVPEGNDVILTSGETEFPEGGPGPWWKDKAKLTGLAQAFIFGMILFSTWYAMVKYGFNMPGLAIAGIAMWKIAEGMIQSGIPHLKDPKIIALTIGTIVLLATILAKNGKGKKRDPDKYEKGMQEFNQEVTTVWSEGPVYTLLTGAAIGLLGVQLGFNGPASDGGEKFDVPHITLKEKLEEDSRGSKIEYTKNKNPYGAVFVLQQPQNTKVVFVSPDGYDRNTGALKDKVTWATLKPNLQFASEKPPNSYIPFFLANGKPNPRAVLGVTVGRQLTELAKSDFANHNTRTGSISAASAINKQVQIVGFN